MGRLTFAGIIIQALFIRELAIINVNLNFVMSIMASSFDLFGDLSRNAKAAPKTATSSLQAIPIFHKS